MSDGKAFDIAGKVLGFLILVLIVYAIYSKFFDNGDDSKKEDKEISSVDSTIEKMSNKHNAISLNEITEKITRGDSFTKTIVSVELEDAIESLKGRPICAELNLADVFRQRSKYGALFTTGHMEVLFPGQVYQYINLEIDSTQKEYLLNNFTNSWSESFFVIMTLDSFKRSDYVLYSPHAEEPQNYIEIELLAPGAVILQGKLIEVEYLKGRY